MIVSRAPRSPALAAFVDALWVHQGELSHRYERLLPSGRMQLLVNLHSDELCDYTPEGCPANWTRGAALQGARIAPVLIDTSHQRHICGVSLAAGGARHLLGVPADELCGRVFNLSDIWGRDGDRLRERLLEAIGPAKQLDLLEAALLERGTSFDRGCSEVILACRLLEHGASVRSLCDRLGLTPRRLINLFRTHVGVAPKLFARLARFQAVLRGRAAETPWIELAAAHGFSDQAHMIREFGVFAGMTPSEYRARSGQAIHHVERSERQFPPIRDPPGNDTL